MPSGSAESPPTRENLCAAICLLALIIERPQGLDQLLSKDESVNQNDESFSRGSTLENTKSLTAAADVDAEGDGLRNHCCMEGYRRDGPAIRKPQSVCRLKDS